MIALKRIDTPLGRMRVGATEKGICLFDFQFRRAVEGIMERVERLLDDKFAETDSPYFSILETQIAEYFNGTRKEFDVPLHLTGTPFQKSVWEALKDIPYGETRSYKQQSVAMGQEKAIRAIASANGDNPIAIIIPCHRIIGEDGSLTGYSGGLQRKQQLLDLERRFSGKFTQAQLF
ncbi:MAG: methylated-DNA--[protein]-cysteine S-methyltransferase [Chitinophagaceae bacterium]|nr:methylated-DNA--[protein]-cysteine S-methyltransferase [Chitinophagaceae bacterium]